VLNLICIRLSLPFEASLELQSYWARIFLCQKTFLKSWAPEWCAIQGFTALEGCFVLPTGRIFLAAIIYDPQSVEYRKRQTIALGKCSLSVA